MARIQAIEFELGGKNLTKNEIEILKPIYSWKGITAGALGKRLELVKNDFTDRNAIVEIRYPGLAPIGQKIDDYYKKGRSITDVNEIGGVGEMIATKEDVLVTAANNKISIDEAKNRLKAKGFQIEGE